MGSTPTGLAPRPDSKEPGLKGGSAAHNGCIPFSLSPGATGARVTSGQGNKGTGMQGCTDASPNEQKINYAFGRRAFSMRAGICGEPRSGNRDDREDPGPSRRNI